MTESRTRKARTKKGCPKPSGISLIELLLAVAIGAIVILGILSLYMAGQKYFFNQDARADIINDSRVTLTWLSRDIKEAIEVVPGPVDIGGTNYSTSANCIVLREYLLRKPYTPAEKDLFIAG